MFIFSITKEFLIDLYNKQNGKCYYSDIKMRIEIEKRNRNNNDYYSLSVDRLDSLKGYTEDNTILCCSVINIMKNGLSEQEFLDICGKICFKNFPLPQVPKDTQSKCSWVSYLHSNLV
jgi:hypothetical protein